MLGVAGWIAAGIVALVLLGFLLNARSDGDPISGLNACSISSPPCITSEGMVLLAVPNAVGDRLMTLDEYREFRQEARELGFR